jgi:glycolate oxidase iron-sulfur subunit
MARPFTGPFTPLEADLSKCVHCGLCLENCPTYIETGLETESPRGRLHLIRALAEERIEATPNVIGHLDLCLQCRNCEAVCPSGAPYGRIMEGARAEIMEGGAAPWQWKLRRLFLREVIARPGRLAVMAAALRLYQRSGLRAVAEMAPGLRERSQLAPEIRGRPFRERGLLAEAEGKERRRVAFLAGCIMPLAYGRVHRATVRVLARNGLRVAAPPAQACCGALHAHNGDRRTALQLARRNIDAFLAEDADAIVVNSAGCGSAMKEYGELLRADPVYHQRAARFSSMVKDVHEFLLELPPEPPSRAVNLSVTYQESCHLSHAQRLADAPRRIMAQIPGLDLREMRHPDRCCGSAGVYSLTQPAMSLKLMDARAKEARNTGASAIVTANPGCMAQMETAVRRHKLPMRVLHVIELLDRAYGG